MNKPKILTLMVNKFQQKHNRKPAKIVIAPVALVTLGIRRQISPEWEGIPVECRLFQDNEVVRKHTKEPVQKLGVFVKENRGQLHLAACDLI